MVYNRPQTHAKRTFPLYYITVKEESTHYKAYILRIWQVERAGQPVLVASLEDCQTHIRKLFASLIEMLPYLEAAAQQEGKNPKQN